MQFGEKLKEILEEREISQKELASALNIAPTTLNGYIKCRRQPDPELIKKTGLILNVSTDILLDFDGGGVKPSVKETSLILKLRELDEQHQRIIYDLVNITSKRLNKK